MIFYTGCTHFNHLLLAQIRGFKTTQEHDKWLIERWNEQATRKDFVWVLGDFMFGKKSEIKSLRHKLQGKIGIILGNHDYKNKLYNMKELFSEMYDIKEVKIKGHKTVLCHYPFRTWSSSHYNSWHLHSHSHNKLPPIGKQLDVGIDTRKSGSFYTEDEIVDIMLYWRKDNFNYLEKNNDNSSRSS